MHPDDRGALSSSRLLAVWPVAGAWALLYGGLGGPPVKGGCLLGGLKAPGASPVSSAGSLGAGLEEAWQQAQATGLCRGG